MFINKVWHEVDELGEEVHEVAEGAEVLGFVDPPGSKDPEPDRDQITFDSRYVDTAVVPVVSRQQVSLEPQHMCCNQLS